MRQKLIVKIVLTLLVFPLVGVLNAAAQCGGEVRKTSFAPGSAIFPGLLQPAALLQERHGKWDDERGEDGLEPIVGLWKIEFTDQSKNYSDKGYATWHSDYTEFQNSERVPSTGAVCQGVWEKIGRSTYRLNHYALAYGDSLNLTNVIRIREEVTVDRSRKHFTGAFITDVYDTSHNLLVEFKGPITGHRVTIDSGIDSQ